MKSPATTNALEPFARKYLMARPLFMSLIRTQEAYLFKKYASLSLPSLDFGCGDGFFAATVYGKKNIDVGLDIAESRASEARESSVYKQIKFYEGQKIPFSKNFFATAISNCVLEHIPHVATVVSEIQRVLKPNGYFYASVMTNRWEDYMIGSKILGSVYKSFMRKQQKHHSLHSLIRWRKVFQDAGFSIKAEIGYLSEKTSGYLDLFHYLSTPSLINRLVSNSWNTLPKKLVSTFQLEKQITKLITFTENSDDSAAVFFVLQKN